MQLTGLVKAEKYNDRVGQVCFHIAEADKFQVHLAPDRHVVKISGVNCCVIEQDMFAHPRAYTSSHI